MEKSVNSDPCYRDLKKVYNSELSKLKQLEAEFDKISSTAVVFSKKENPQELMNWRKMYRLMAEISLLKTSPPKSIPVNQELLLLTTYKELLSEIECLDSLKNSLHEEAETLLKTQSKVKSDLEEELQHLEAVKRKCVAEGIDVHSSSSSSTAVNVIKDSEDQVLKSKIDKWKALNKVRAGQLFEFLDTYFPVPTEAQIEAITSKDIFTELSETPLKSMKDIIILLISHHFKDPQESWIKLDSTFWQPHIEFLLRCGIVHRKPENCLFFKLENFYL